VIVLSAINNPLDRSKFEEPPSPHCPERFKCPLLQIVHLPDDFSGLNPQACLDCLLSHPEEWNITRLKLLVESIASATDNNSY
jgi:hypothetical protein